MQTKQELLDKIPEDNYEFMTQQLLWGMNETQVLKAAQSIRQIYKCAFKSYLKELTLKDILFCIEMADKLNKEAKNAKRKMEKQK